MAPNSAEEREARKMNNREIALQAGRRLAMCPAGEEVMLTGIAGTFPDSDDVWELGQNLIDKKDLISGDERRWKNEHHEIPQRTGKLREVNKFDASFFGIHYKQATAMDPMSRILLEKTYEAIVDAGYNPKELRGSRMGVFIGACFSESEKTWFYEKIQIDGFGITGCSRAMLANRISYWLGVNGPSYTVDSACSSSLYAIEHAYKAIRDGLCDSAIVGGANLCLHPYVSLQFARLGVLSPDGRCKSFDETANGYCRSETVCVVFLQKKSDARRVYARLVHAKTNCDGYKEQGITYPSGEMQQKLLEEFYDECRVKPSALAWVEAHGTGTVVGDPEEVGALDAVFCPGRNTPLRIGSVKSNLGHSEPASGLVSVSKVVIAMERKLIPPNINLTKLRSDIDAFNAGRITVVTEPEPWDGGLVGVNSFGFGGANCHVLLESNPKEKGNGGTPQDDIPRLVAISGRTKEAVEKILSDLESRPLDKEYVRLWHEVQKMEIPGHLYRGYILKKKNSNEVPIKDVEFYPGVTRKLWFVFAGMGSQWPGMGKSLMLIPTFEKAIRECHRILKPKGVDLVRILTSEDPKTFDNILNSFVGIAAIQIGLVDVLNSLGIIPEGIVGHSVGELGCAYADGCFTAEQTILAAYYRGLASLETNFIYGSMASIGMGYAEAKNEVPSEIDIACHNGPNSCTISGPAEIVKKYVETLKEKGVFAKEVKVANIAYHSRYIKDAAPKLMKYLKQVIPKPKPRSKKWISSSVKQAEWNTENAKYSSAEYHTNNLLSSVYFEEATTHIPAKAVVVEIAPHGLLQAILKRSLNDVINIPLTQMNHADNIDFFLTALGRLFEAGFNPQLQNLYPQVDFPVSRATPMLSPLVRWEHSEDWYVTSYQMQERMKSGERTVKVSLKDEELEYVSGHVIDGRNLFPATGYLILAWETVGLMRGELYTQVPVVFENVRFNRATNVPKEGVVEFTVMVHKGSGNFEVIEGGAAVVTGNVRVPENVDKEMVNVTLPSLDATSANQDLLPLTAKDVYKELRLRGYNYKGLFRGITSANNEGTCATVSWVNNYVAFMDNMLQIQILGQDTRGLFVPTFLRKLVINTKKHSAMIRSMPEGKTEFGVEYYKEIELVRSGGIEVRGLKASAITRRKPLGEPVLEKYKFVPHVNPKCQSLEEAVLICTHLALENLPLLKVKTMEVIDSAAKEDAPLISKMIVRVLGDLPLIQAEVVVLSKSDHPLVAELEGVNLIVEDKKLPADQSSLMVVATQLLSRPELLQSALSTLKEGGYLMSRERIEDKLEPTNLDVCLDYAIDNERIVLLKKKSDKKMEPILFKIDGNSFSWVSELKKVTKVLQENKKQEVILYAEKDQLNGIMGLFNCLRKEPYGNNVRCFFIMDDTAPAFSLSHPLYRTQYEKNLAANVFQNGSWGTYRHLPLEETQKIKTHHAYVNSLIKGDLTSLNWMEGDIDPNAIGDKSKLIHIYYASLNFRDVMIASGKLSVEVICKDRRRQDCLQGFEYSGKSTDGTRYMGMSAGGTMSNWTTCDPMFLWKVPDYWTLEDAATIPVVYGTVVYAFMYHGRLKKGDSVLIHAGTGGVGQAAINICSYYECDIYTTVGTEEKRQFIRDHFPQIPENHIGNSRDTSFEQMIMRETKGRGVDVVLNSLAEEKLLASLRCLAPRGRFLEIGKFDLAKNNTIGMEVFLKETSFHSVMLDLMFEEGGHASKNKEYLHGLLKQHVECGAVKPLVRTIFEVDQVEHAYRYMAAGKHIGKVLLRIRPEEENKLSIPKNLMMDAFPRYLCKENRSFILCGGLGGFGLELADWMVLRGARKIVLTSRYGIRSGYQSLRIRVWRSYGVQVLISKLDITTEDGARALIQEANQLAPVAAIFNLAVVLKDAAFEDQTEETFAMSAGPKARATHYLDQLSRKMCPHLEQFVVFSSVSCGRGNLGQTNYGLSNSVMERICEARKADGLPATAVEWGAVGEVGLVADMAEDNLEFVIGGTLQQRVASCLEVMDYFLRQDNPIVASMVVAEKRSGGATGGTVVDTVINILGLRDLKTVSLHSTLAELGMDSMMAVEIKQTLEREFEVFLAPQDIRSLTFAKLQEIAAATTDSGADGDKSVVGVKANEGEIVSEVGLNYLMRVIMTEEQARQTVVRLPSLLHDGSTVEVPSAQNPTIFILPGVEGVASVMAPLAAFFNAQVLCLQYPFEDIPNSIQEIAQILAKQIKKRLPVDGYFQLVGYSFGGLVALEVVKILEREGRKGHLWLIDSSPEFISTVVKLSLLAGLDQEEMLQVESLIAFMNLISPQLAKDIKEDLYKLPNLESRIAFVQSKMKETGIQNEYSSSYLEKLMMAGYKRIKAVVEYSPTTEQLIKASIVLIRPTDVAIPLSEDYELKKYFANPVHVYFENGNHFTILENKKVAEIIMSGGEAQQKEKFNAYLKEDYLEKLKFQNQ